MDMSTRAQALAVLQIPCPSPKAGALGKSRDFGKKCPSSDFFSKTFFFRIFFSSVRNKSVQVLGY